jgi:hypothetical protein
MKPCAHFVVMTSRPVVVTTGKIQVVCAACQYAWEVEAAEYEVKGLVMWSRRYRGASKTGK